MSSPPRPIRSAPPRPAVPAPTRPISPYISLDDANTEKFFNRTRIHNHLRRAGLLNKNGEILTQAEYDSKQKDIAIGRENQRKIDDVITEVLCDLAREHWAYTRDYTEQMRTDLMHQFRRMENQYRRRTQPITIRHRSDGKFQIQTDGTTSHNQSDVSNDLISSSTGTLPPLKPDNKVPSSRSLPLTTVRPSNDLDDIRKELNKMKDIVASLEKKLNQGLGNNENSRNLPEINQILNDIRNQQIIIQQQQQTLNDKLNQGNKNSDEEIRKSGSNKNENGAKPSELDRQTTEDFSKLSILIQELQNRILNIETSSHHSSTSLSQEATAKPIQTSDNKTNDRQDRIENEARNTNDKLSSLQVQLNQLTTRLNQLPNPVTSTDVHQLIQNEIRNYFEKEKPNNNQQKEFADELTNRINALENQWNVFFQSNRVNVSSSQPQQPTDHPISIQQLVQRADNNLEQRLTDVERQLNNIPLRQDLIQINQRLIQLENKPHSVNDPRVSALQDQLKSTLGQVKTLQEQIAEFDNKKLGRQEAEQRSDSIEERIKQLHNLYNGVINGLATKSDSQKVDQLIQNSEYINQQINVLEQSVTDNRGYLRRMAQRLSNIEARLKSPTTTSSDLSKQSKLQEDENVLQKPTAKELQAIMPFIEFLPTFDMFNEHEWI